MNRIQIDRYIGQTPCLCGDLGTWHPSCYKGKTDAQIKAAQDRVYAKVRRILAKKRRAALTSALSGDLQP